MFGMEFNIQQLILRGGVVMIPLISLSLVAVTVCVERLLFYALEYRRWKRSVVQDILLLAKEGQFDRATDLASESLDPRALVLKASLEAGPKAFQSAADAVIVSEVAKRRRFLSVIETVITLAPLLGILGTVVGIIMSFNLLGGEGVQDPKAVSVGIAQALLTTAVGLSIAIVVTIPYHWFLSRIQLLEDEFSKVLSELEVAYSRLEN